MADVVIFDPERVTDRATYDDSHRYPEGIPFVIVSGAVVVEGGALTAARPDNIFLVKMNWWLAR